MAGESSKRRIVIAILLTSTLLTMLGIAGLLRGAFDLSLAPLPEDVRDLYEPDAAVSDAEVQLLEAQVSNPYRRPMGAANVVVSALVLIGSFLLSWRRKPAQWWIKQAVAAKLIWITAYTATLVRHIQTTFVVPPVESASADLSEIITGVILVSSFSALLHVTALYRATRPDIRKFIESTGNPGEPSGRV
ncbi:MAG: hypothetical protein PVH21_04925 [Myxococcales bacterium]